METDVKSIQSKVTQCIKSDCPAAAECLRQIVHSKCSAEVEFIRIVNPDAIKMGDKGCQFFKATDTVPYGVGFTTYIAKLPMKVATQARAVLYSYFNSRMQFHRYCKGQLKVSPARRAEMEKVLSKAGLPTPIEFDEVIYDFE